MFQKRQVNVLMQCNFVPVNIFYQIAVNINFYIVWMSVDFLIFLFFVLFPFFFSWKVYVNVV